MEHAQFDVKDCILASIATGLSASSLPEFRDRLIVAHPECIYFHFWSSRLTVGFLHPEYYNDFAMWAYRSLHDPYLAEKLGIIDPTGFEDTNQLRMAVLEVIEERLVQREFFLWEKRKEKFNFIRSKLLVFDTGIKINHPTEFKLALPSMTSSSIFYHFVDAKRRTGVGLDDFSIWLSSYGDEYQSIIAQIGKIDLYFSSLQELKRKIYEILKEI